MKGKYAMRSAIFLLAVLFFAGSQAWAESLYSLGKKGREAFEKEDYPRALDAYTKAQLESPEKPEISYNLGNVQYKNGDFDAAIAHYKSVLTSADRKLKQKARFNMGNAYFRKGDYDKAISEYEEVLKLDQTDDDARKNLAFTKKIRERKKEEPPKQDQKDQKDPKDQKKDSKDTKENGNDQGKKDGDSGKDNTKPDGNSPSKDNTEEKQDKRQKQDQKDQKNPNGQRPDPAESGGGGPHEREPSPGQSMGRENDSSGEGTPADTMLKRLEDQPGKALLLDRRPRKVEKDW